MKYILIAVMFLSFGASADEYLGQLTDNPYAANSITSPTSTYQAKPYSATPPKLYNSQGEYRGELSTDQYRADSISNPYGRYGSKYSADSINNPYGAGSEYGADSPNNPYGEGLSVYSDDGY